MAEPAASSRPEQNRLLGIALRIGATSCFAFMAAGIKLGYAHGVSTVEIAFYRFFFGLPPLLVWIAWTGNFGAWRTKRPLTHLTRTAIGLTTMVLGFSSLRYLPLAESTTIGFVAPLVAVMLSALILKEAVGPHRWSAVAAGFIGVLIVMQPQSGHLPTIGLALALGATFGMGFVTILIRQIGRTESTQTTVLWLTTCSTIATGMLMPFFAEFHDLRTWAILVALGLFGGAAQLMLTASLRYAPVAVVVPFDYAQLLWAVLLGWFLWNTPVPGSTWLGAAVIIASGLYTIYREHKLGRDRQKAESPL